MHVSSDADLLKRALTSEVLLGTPRDHYERLARTSEESTLGNAA